MAVGTRWPLVGRRDELDVFAGALRDPQLEAVCIYGPSGVGKTRLGDECLLVAEAAGRRVLRATADRSEQNVPLAALAHLLPAGALTDWEAGGLEGSITRARLLDRALVTLAPTAGESGPPVLLLDDAHHLDRSSLGIVDRLMAASAVFCVATVNTGEPAREIVMQWWRDERAIRLDLGALDPVGVDTLLHVALEGALDGVALAELWRASHGNLLILHELVHGALADGSLAQGDGVWRLHTALCLPSRVHDLVKWRIDGLGGSHRAVLELLAVCQAVGLGELESAFGLAVLEDLEHDGLIEVRADGRRQSVGLAHPQHGEVIRAGMTEQRSQALMLGHADTLERLGARRREDPVRIATLRLEATGRADPDLLLRAARIARAECDFATAARLAEASLAARASALGGLLLGEALHNLGLFERAESVFAASPRRSANDDVAANFAAMRRRNQVFGLGRDESVAFEAAPGQAELLTREAELLAYSGRPLDAVALLAGVDDSPQRIGVLAAVARTAALSMTGRTAEALALSERAHHDHVALDDPVGTSSPGIHRVHALDALVQAGRLAEAAERGSSWFDVAVTARLPIETMWLAVHLARGALAEGRPVTSKRWADRAASGIAAHRFEGLRRVAVAVRAIADGVLGDVVAASERVGELERLPSGFGCFDAELALARAWALVAGGDSAAAHSVLLAAADDAERSGLVPATAWLLHDAVRLGPGHAAQAVEQKLAELAASTDSQLVHMRADHTAALAAGDGDRLSKMSERFESIGAVLLAAEAAAQAASVLRNADRDRAAALDARTTALAARCEGAKTPMLVRARTMVLSDRERDIAVLAAEGHSSRAIAERLSISVRTVDNHLGHIYTKLGVSGRAELTGALAFVRREDEPA
jgi:DNA-binding CsgD family transcriptional regulator